MPRRPAPVAATTKPTERKAITLDNVTLDRYVGSYTLADSLLFVVKREGNQLKTQLTGQGFAGHFSRERNEVLLQGRGRAAGICGRPEWFG